MVKVIAAGLGVFDETVRLAAKRFAETGQDVEATIGRKGRDLPPFRRRSPERSRPG